MNETPFINALRSKEASLFLGLSKQEGDLSLWAEAFKDTIKERGDLSVVEAGGALSLVEEALGGASLFTQEPLVIIWGVDKWNAAFQKTVMDRLENFSGKACFLGLKLAKNTKLYKFFQEKAQVLDLSDEKPWEVQKRLSHELVHQAHLLGKSLELNLAQSLVQHCSCRLLLSTELQKVAMYVGDREQITREDLQAVGFLSSEYTQWQLMDALLHQDLHSALLFFNELLEQSPAPMLLASLRTQAQNALMLWQFDHSHQKEKMTQHFPYLKGNILSKKLEALRKVGQPFLRGLLIDIHEADHGFKEGQAPEHLVKRFLAKRAAHV